MSQHDARGPVGIVGCGTMGAGIAEACARAGFDVAVRVLDEAHLEGGRARIAASLDRAVAGGRIEQAVRDHALGRISFVTAYDGLAGVGVAIEAVPERLDVKREVFRELGEACPQAILATNTSSLPVIEVAAASGVPGRVVGLHFFNPAPAMPLVEVAATVATESVVREQAVEFARAAGKTPVECRDRAGFIANLLLFPYLNEAVRMLDAGAGAYRGSANCRCSDSRISAQASSPMRSMSSSGPIGCPAPSRMAASMSSRLAAPASSIRTASFR